MFNAANPFHLNYSKYMFMNFNRTRPYRISFTIDNNPVRNVITANDLGVIFDSKLCFNLHLAIIDNKAKGVFGFVKRCSNCSSRLYHVQSFGTH